MPAIRLSVRELVEFLLRTGSIDSRFTGFDRANEGARIHRRLQKAAGEGYAAEVFLTAERTMEGIGFTIEGRADGIFTDEDGTVVIDEIKTTAAPADAITEDMNPCHWAQGMVYGAIYAKQQGLKQLDVRLTYYQIDTDEIIRYTRHFSAAELDAFLNDLLRQYLPWARRQLDWVEARNRSLGALQFQVLLEFRRVLFCAPLPGRSIAPVLRARQSRRAVPGCSARHPPASAKR